MPARRYGERMKRIGLGATLLLSAVLLSGCTGQNAPSPDALQTWTDAQNDAAVSDTRMLSQTSSTTGENEKLRAGEGATAAFPTPETVSEIVYACTGPDAMSFEVEVSQKSESTVLRFEDLPCSDQLTALDLPEFTDVTQVRMNGASATAGAWSMTVRGPA